MPVKLHENLHQGTEEWYAARCGLMTASEMKLVITPGKLQYASNDKERAQLYELAAQRVNKYVEPTFQSFDMQRGNEDEIEALNIYNKNIAPVECVGFITNDEWGFTLGYSPDGLVGDHGQIEAKSRKQKYQMETILSRSMPDDFLIQVQTGLLVSKRQWCDFISFCGGMPMMVLRVAPDPVVQNAIIEVAGAFEKKLSDRVKEYREIVTAPPEGLKFFPTERRKEEIEA